MGVAVEVIEKGFSKRGLTECELSILIGMDSFAYLIKDTEGQVQALKEYQMDVAQDEKEWAFMMENEPLLVETYKTVQIGIALPPFTFIPEDLFNKKLAREYINHQTTLSKEDEVKEILIPEAQAYNLFVVPAWLKRRLAELPKPDKVAHLSGTLLLKAKAYSDEMDQPFLWAHINPGRIWLGALENGELKYANSFPFSTDNDALYYLLMLFEHTGLAPDRTTIYLSGRISTDLTLFKNLIRFVAQPEFIKVENQLNFGPQLQQYPEHWFYDLLSLSN